MLPLIFVLPVIQLVVLVSAANFEIKSINYAVLDADKSQTSRQLINKLGSTGYYRLVDYVSSEEEGKTLMDQNKIDLLLELPGNFEHDLQNLGRANLMLDVSAIDGSAASVIFYYTNSVIADFNADVVTNWNRLPQAVATPLKVESRFWYNPELEYKNNMAPGLVVVLVTMIGMFLSAMNIVREKELGTIEQLNVTPITKTQFLISKLAPFWIIGLFEFGFGLTIGKLIFNFPVLGSISLLVAFAALYLIAVLGIGLLISTVTHTQQQAMLIAWFFIVIFILMSGLFTAIENMPEWAQRITLVNPVAYFVDITRLVLLKGSEFRHVTRHFLVLGVMSVVINTLAVLSYHKRS
jgi:ABC-2 type transport system permease protein